MTVRAKTGRSRYVAFRIERGAPLSRSAVERLLPEGDRLTRFDGTHGIAKTNHVRRAALVEALRGATRAGGADIRIQTIATSGSVQGAARRLPRDAPAAARGPRPPRGAKRTPKPPSREDTLK